MAYTKYSLTPANNNATPPDGAPEGMLPSAVNDTMRDMMAQIRDVGDGIRNGTYTMTAPVITGGSITGVALSGNTFTNPVITGGSINNTPIGATTASTGRFSTITGTGLTSGRVTYATTNGQLTDDADFTFNGTTVTMANDASISGLTVGKGGGAVTSNTVVGGSGALGVNTTGYSNTVLGRFAAQANTTGNNIIAIGDQALFTNTTGNANIAIGTASLNANTTGNFNTAVGNGNTGVSGGALALNTTGSNNSAFGYQSLYFNTTASNNTAVGYQAGYSNTTAAQQTAIGFQSFYSSNRTADTNGYNTGLGFQSGYTTSTGNFNTFIGQSAGYFVTTGSVNTFLGSAAGSQVTTGSKNTILGPFSGNNGGLDIRTANNYIVLSDGDGNPRGVFDGSGNLFVGATSSALNSTRFLSFQDSNASAITARCTSTSQGSDVILARASRNTTNGSFQAITYYNDGAGAYRFVVSDSGNVINTNGSYGTISDAKLKENIVDATSKLDKVNQLKVRNFNLIGDDLKQIGFIAQEFEQVFPSMVEESQDKTPDGELLNTTTKTIKTSVLVPILVKAVQELTAKVEALEAQLNK